MSDVMVFTDPSIDGPKLAFTTGAVSNGQAVINPVLPDIPGNLSAWKLSEWTQPSYLDPASMTTNADADPLYGNALYAWQAANSETALRIYSQNGTANGPYVYDLQEAGVPQPSGGADIFLSSNALSGSTSFDHPITFSMDAKLTKAIANYNDPSHAASSVVLSQLLAGFTVTFNAPGSSNYNASEATYSAFLQIDVGSSRQTQADQTVAVPFLDTSTYGTSEAITYTDRLPGDSYLPFQSASGDPTLLTYDLNNYLDSMIALSHLPSYAQDLSQWTLGSMFVGIEAENGLSPDQVQGSVLTDLQLSNINVTTDPDKTVAYNANARADNATLSQPSAPVDPTLFLLDDASTSTTQSVTSDAYNGPLSFLPHGDSFSYNGADSVTMSADAARNPLMATGSGNDVLTGASSGTSVLDGGTGANIESDSGPGQTTFVQNGYVTGPTWDFLQNFHGQDEDIIFGFVPGFSHLIAQAIGGAGTYTGATITVLPGNGNSESVTFDGTPMSSLQGCSLMIDGVPSYLIWAKTS